MRCGLCTAATPRHFDEPTMHTWGRAIDMLETWYSRNNVNVNHRRINHRRITPVLQMPRATNCPQYQTALVPKQAKTPRYACDILFGCNSYFGVSFR